MTWSRIHSAPLRVLPKPRPASSSQVRQSPFGACWLRRPHQPQSCSIASSSRSLVRFRNAARCSGGSDASNSAGETFSDSDGVLSTDDLERTLQNWSCTKGPCSRTTCYWSAPPPLKLGFNAPNPQTVKTVPASQQDFLMEILQKIKRLL